LGNVCRLNIILVAEGAIDREGKPISAEDVKKVNFFTGQPPEPGFVNVCGAQNRFQEIYSARLEIDPGLLKRFANLASDILLWRKLPRTRRINGRCRH
jgi:hypothetical protein